MVVKMVIALGNDDIAGGDTNDDFGDKGKCDADDDNNNDGSNGNVGDWGW